MSVSLARAEDLAGRYELNAESAGGDTLQLFRAQTREMRASFIPGDLHLIETRDGFHVVIMRGSEVLRTRSRKAAAAKFNELRRNLETKYPAAEMIAEEKAELLRKATLDAMVGHNSLGGRKKKTTAGGTRTFGG